MDVEKLSFVIPTVDSKYQTITEHQSHIFRTEGHNVFEDPLCICAYKYQINAIGTILNHCMAKMHDTKPICYQVLLTVPSSGYLIEQKQTVP
jgi:hypothetical protein